MYASKLISVSYMDEIIVPFIKTTITWSTVANIINVAWYKKYISNTLLYIYGSQLWNLSSSSFNDICTVWNKTVRRIFHLPFTTHRFLLPCVTRSDHIRDNLIKRSTTLFQNMMLSDNEVVNSCLSMHVSVTHLFKTRENHWCIPQFDIDEINEMIYHVCTS